MAKGDIRIIDVNGRNSVNTMRFQTEANATAIYTGEPVKLKSAGSPYVIPLADGDPVIGTTTQVMGIAASDSVHTSTADGYIDVYVPSPSTVYAAKAKTASTVDTQSELDALQNDRVVLDLTSSTYTVDAAATDGATKGIQIVGGDPDRAEVWFTIRPAAVEGPIA